MANPVLFLLRHDLQFSTYYRKKREKEKATPKNGFCFYLIL